MNVSSGKEVLIIFLVTTFTIILLTCFVLVILLFHKKAQQNFIIQLENVKAQAEKELLKTQLEIQEQTFQYISREIHDNIGQFISLAKLQLNTLDFTQPLIAEEKTGHSADLLTKALDDLRDLSKSLSSDLIKSHGLTAAIELQVMQLRKVGTAEVKYEVTGEGKYLEEQKEIFVLRIVQEAVNNIIRHSLAAEVRILLNYEPDRLSLSVTDNGKGFDPSIVESRQSSGINNMTKRAAMIGAYLILESKIGEGTTVNLCVPF
jgi:two-component system, NarL family, sensor kinase